MVGEVTGTEQAQFLAGKGHEQDAAFGFRLIGRVLRGEMAGQFDDAGGTGGIVVGAGVNRSRQRRRQRELLAQAEVIVMRPDDHIFVRLAGQICRARYARF